MMKTAAIVYTSNSGFTAQYARLLAEKTGLPCYDAKAAAKTLAAGTDVLYLGWLMAGMVMGMKKARKRYHVKAVCAVGMGTPAMDQLAGIRSNAALGDLPLFYLQGGFDLNKLHGIYRFMMQAISKMRVKNLLEKPDKTADDTEMLSWFQNGGSAVCAENLAAVEAWLRG